MGLQVTSERHILSGLIITNALKSQSLLFTSAPMSDTAVLLLQQENINASRGNNATTTNWRPT